MSGCSGRPSKKPLQLFLPSSKCKARASCKPAVVQRPLVSERYQYWLPEWLQLYAERGPLLKCWEGHRLFADRQDGRRHGDCSRCGKRPPPGDRLMVCRTCDDYAVCSACTLERKAKPLPSLAADPLFQGPDSPCLLMPPSQASGRGTVIVCPGGNYEFLCPHEGMPIVDFLASHGITALVLRYRLLPRHSPSAAVADLAKAVRLVRALRGGPVAAIGFSAGGHLVASYSQRYGPASGRTRGTSLSSKQPLLKFSCSALRRKDKVCAMLKKSHRHQHRHHLHGRSHHKHRGLHKAAGTDGLDAQVLVYPAIDGRGWLRDEECGFWNYEECMDQAHHFMEQQEALMGGMGFAAPPSFLVASNGDPVCPPKEHADVYAAALSKRRIPHHYLRRNFGDHGFGLSGGWAPRCAKWLKSAGFGEL